MVAIPSIGRPVIPKVVTGTIRGAFGPGFRIPAPDHAGGLAAAAAPGPYAPLSPGQIAQQVNRYKATLPAPLSDAQIQTRAQGELDPIVQRVTDAINARAKAAGAAISGYTGSLADALGHVDYGAPYVGAEDKQAAVDASLASALAGAGTQSAADLQSRLGQIGESGVVDAAAHAVEGNATGNSNAVLAGGSANLGALIANEAAARSYGQKLPGIARLGGLQDIAAANQSAQTQVGDQTTQVLDQLPSIVNDLRSQAATNASNRAQLGEHVFEFLTGHNTDVANAKAANTKNQIGTILSLGVDPSTGRLTAGAAKALSKLTGVDASALSGTDGSTARKLIASAAPKVIGSGSAGYYTYDPATGTTTQVVKPAPKAQRPVIVGSDKTGRYELDPATGKKTLVTAPVKGGAGGGLSSSSLSSLVKHVNDTVAKAKQGSAPHELYKPTDKNADASGFITVPGTGTSPTSYQEALASAVAAGPNTSAWRSKAQSVVDAHYQPGELGRPWGAEATPVAIQTAKAALAAGLSIEDAHQKMVDAQLPAGIVTKALRKIYYQSSAFSPIPGSPHYHPAAG